MIGDDVVNFNQKVVDFFCHKIVKLYRMSVNENDGENDIVN